MCYKITIKPACGLHVVRITEACGESEYECDLPVRIRSYALDHYVLCPKCSARREAIVGPGVYIFDRVPRPAEHHPSETLPLTPPPPHKVSPVFGLPTSPRDSMVLVHRDSQIQTPTKTPTKTKPNPKPHKPTPIQKPKPQPISIPAPDPNANASANANFDQDPISPPLTPRRRSLFQTQTSTREKRAGRILLPPRPVSGRVNPRAESYRRAREWIEQNRRSTILEEDEDGDGCEGGEGGEEGERGGEGNGEGEGGETDFSSGCCSQPSSEDERFVQAEARRLMGG